MGGKNGIVHGSREAPTPALTAAATLPAQPCAELWSLPRRRGKSPDLGKTPGERRPAEITLTATGISAPARRNGLLGCLGERERGWVLTDPLCHGELHRKALRRDLRCCCGVHGA